MEKPRLLIVDDVPQNISVLGEAMRDEYDVRIATSGEKALAIVASEEKPDIILLDIMMPHMDGYEVMRRLKAAPATKDIPVMFLTALGEPVDERKGLDLGAVDYVIKPFNVDVVMARVRNHLALRQHVEFLEWMYKEKTQTLQSVTAEYRKALRTGSQWKAELEFLKNG